MNSKQRKCEHVWLYVHTVYTGQRGGLCVRRWCHRCNLEQVGHVGRWRLPREKEFDESAEKAAERESAPR